MLIPKFIFYTALLLTLQEVFSNICESGEFSSPFSNYQKLVGGPASYDA